MIGKLESMVLKFFMSIIVLLFYQKLQLSNKETTLEYLLRKSGCKQKLKNISSDIKLTRYQSKKHSISFCEYKEYISKI